MVKFEEFLHNWHWLESHSGGMNTPPVFRAVKPEDRDGFNLALLIGCYYFLLALVMSGKMGWFVD